MTHTVGISQMRVCGDPEDVLVTYSLGSCIGLALYDPVVRVGGLIHCMLPLSRIDPVKAESNPQMFTDTGVPALLGAMCAAGAGAERLVAKVAGGGCLLGDRGMFRIGERNYLALRKALWRHDILIAGEYTGGTGAMALCLEVGTGRTVVRLDGRELEL